MEIMKRIYLLLLVALVATGCNRSDVAFEEGATEATEAVTEKPCAEEKTEGAMPETESVEKPIVEEKTTEIVVVKEETIITEEISAVENPPVETPLIETPAVETPEVENPAVEQNAESSVYGKVIVIDAGHGKNSDKGKEPVAPGSDELKAKFATGTQGANQTEAELNLAIALWLEKELKARGAIVHMTRTTAETTLSNVGRAEFANNLNADISVKIHADGLDNPSVHGASILVPGDKYITDSELVAESRRAGEIIISEYVKATGARDRGVSVRNDMTGFNWSRVPVVLLEMGFMTNPEEDARMENEEYRQLMVNGIVRGLEVYFAN